MRLAPFAAIGAGEDRITGELPGSQCGEQLLSLAGENDVTRLAPFALAHRDDAGVAVEVRRGSFQPNRACQSITGKELG